MYVGGAYIRIDVKMRVVLSYQVLLSLDQRFLASRKGSSLNSFLQGGGIR